MNANINQEFDSALCSSPTSKADAAKGIPDGTAETFLKLQEVRNPPLNMTERTVNVQEEAMLKAKN